MNKEIIELLKDFKTISDSDCIYELFSQDCKLLLDYITNLQERLDKAQSIIRYYWTDGFEDIYDMLNNISDALRGEDYGNNTNS